jgi:hypothetical protein
MGLVVTMAFVMSIPANLERLVQVLSDTTVYSRGFTEAGFRSIRIGMSRRDLVQVMGEPLAARMCTDGLILEYSRSSCDSDYYIRRVVVDRDGRVVRVEASWYWD